MGNRYFVFSDVHGFHDELRKALERKGFDIGNPEHHVIFCGDMLDRGPKPLETYEFLRSIPRERRTMIRGNHELLLHDLLVRGKPLEHDLHNGTYQTCLDVRGVPEFHAWYEAGHEDLGVWDAWVAYFEYADDLSNGRTTEIDEWIRSDEWQWFLETDRHVFVHSWVPMKTSYTNGVDTYDEPCLPPERRPYYETVNSYRDDWREATDEEWVGAVWGCPWDNELKGLNGTGKTIVCGHWHTSDFFNHLTKQRKVATDNPLFVSKRHHLIGLDAMTALSRRVNVLVLDEEEL